MCVPLMAADPLTGCITPGSVSLLVRLRVGRCLATRACAIIRAASISRVAARHAAECAVTVQGSPLMPEPHTEMLIAIAAIIAMCIIAALNVAVIMWYSS